jgi:hypothetical protein
MGTVPVQCQLDAPVINAVSLGRFLSRALTYAGRY